MNLWKTCPDCQKNKGRDDFYVDRKRSNAMHTYCRECSKIRSKRSYAAADKTARSRNHRAWVQSNREHIRAYKIANALGVSIKTVKRILARGVCDICGSNAVLCVDHCHRRGQIRGLLCAACNKGLGFFGDNPMRLAKAAKYLKPDIFEATYEPADQ